MTSHKCARGGPRGNERLEMESRTRRLATPRTTALIAFPRLLTEVTPSPANHAVIEGRVKVGYNEGRKGEERRKQAHGS